MTESLDGNTRRIWTPGGAGAYGEREGMRATHGRLHPKYYRRFWAYYENRDDLYVEIGKAVMLQTSPGAISEAAGSESQSGALKSAIKTLRNPIHRVVEFYATTMLVGTARQSLPFGEIEDPLRQAIHRFWEMSNLSVRKQVLKRWLGIYGRVWGKVNAGAENDPTVWAQFIAPEFATDFDFNNKGQVIYMRLDVPFEDKEKKAAGYPFEMVRTEIWRKGGVSKSGQRSEGYVRVWERPKDTVEDTVVAEGALSDPLWGRRLSEEGTSASKSMGFDFVPFVDIKAQDTGRRYPAPIYNHAMPLVDESNRMATRYHNLLFRYNKPFKGIQGIGNDPSGRPMSAPGIVDQRPTQTRQAFGGEIATLLEAQTGVDMTLDGDIVLGLPGTSTAVDLTPNLEYRAMKEAILLMADEMEQELPELLYFKTLDKAEISGRALRLIMAGAIDRTYEMRSNVEAGVIDLNKMGLTVGQLKNLEGFRESQIGKYDKANPEDSFPHYFLERDILSLSDLENEELRGRRIANALALMQIGIPREQAFAEVGLSHIRFEQRQIDDAGGPPESEGAAGVIQPGVGGNGELNTGQLEEAARRLNSQMGTFGSSRA
jgi:hypothetical protein